VGSAEAGPWRRLVDDVEAFVEHERCTGPDTLALSPSVQGRRWVERVSTTPESEPPGDV
jgi:hypothetical protein